MAVKRKLTTSIEIKSPRGVELTKAIMDRAAAAAQIVIDEFSRLVVARNVLREQGINLSIEDIIALTEKRGMKSAVESKEVRVVRGRKRVGKRALKKRVAPGKKAGKVGRAKKAGRKGKGKRVVLSMEQRAEVVEALRGGITAHEVAKQFGVSVATVNNIKKEAGLVKSRR